MYHLICLTMDTTMYLLMRKFYSQNVPIILKRIYIHKAISTKRIYFDKVISTNLKKRSMKRLLLDTCTKIAFTFNGGIYEQRDGVCMAFSLCLLLANVIMTDFEKKVIKPLINDNAIKFYTRYL